jgi:hypothetical protein
MVTVACRLLLVAVVLAVSNFHPSIFFSSPPTDGLTDNGVFFAPSHSSSLFVHSFFYNSNFQ